MTVHQGRTRLGRRDIGEVTFTITIARHDYSDLAISELGLRAGALGTLFAASALLQTASPYKTLGA